MGYLFLEVATLEVISELLDCSALNEPKFLLSSISRVDQMFGSKDGSFEMPGKFN